jgi:hypothetical protein
VCPRGRGHHPSRGTSVTKALRPEDLAYFKEQKDQYNVTPYMLSGGKDTEMTHSKDNFCT